jgi:nucleoside-diphosphate-sugar epimerase
MDRGDVRIWLTLNLLKPFWMQPGDVPATYADISDLTKAFDFRPQTSIEVGIDHFVRWYKDYYKTVN